MTHRLADELADAITIDSLLDQYRFTTVDLMKIDVEGAEAVIFAQPQPWMKRVRRIGLDLHGRYVDVARIKRVLVEAGYSVVPTGVPRLVLFDRGVR